MFFIPCLVQYLGSNRDDRIHFEVGNSCIQGPLGLDFKPEGGPTVPGKFAEAVFPESTGKTESSTVHLETK